MALRASVLLLLLALGARAASTSGQADRVSSLPSYGDVDWLHAG